MASTDIDPRRSLNDLDTFSFAFNVNSKIARRVVDDEAVAVLGQILTALGGATFLTPTIYNLSVPLANTEVSQALPTNFKKLLVRCRGNARTQFSFTSGQSGTNYITIPMGSSYSADGLMVASGTIYLQTSQASQTIEIIAWS